MQPFPRLALGVGVSMLGLLIAPIGGAGPSARATGPLVALSIADGKVAAAAPVFGPRGAVVDAVLADGRGGWWVGGSFTHIDEVHCPYLVHLLPDVKFDRNWCPRPNGRVQRLAASGDTVFAAGGLMTRVGGIPRKGVAAIDGRTGKVLPWNPRPDYAVDGRGLAVDRSTLYLTGGFEHIGGKARHQLAAL